MVTRLFGQDELLKTIFTYETEITADENDALHATFWQIQSHKCFAVIKVL